jgi:hypothetical protein
MEVNMYKKVSTDLNFVDREKQTEKFWEDNPKIRQGVLPYFSCILCHLSSPAYQYNDQTEDQDHQRHTSPGDHILFRS